MNTLILHLNNKEYLEFSSNLKPLSLQAMPIDRLGKYLNIKIVFYSGRKKYLLSSFQMAFDAINGFCSRLRKALHNQLLLNFSITRNIGFTHNRHFRTGEKCPWEGDDFYVWWASGKQPYLETWIYNEEHGNIIMCVSELYYWFGLDNSISKNYVSYRKYMKKYPEPLIRIIPHQVARQWLAQCEYLLAIVSKNERSGSYRKEILAANGIYE